MKAATASIRLRLFLLALAGIVVALGLSGWSLNLLFGRYLERRLAQELDTHVAQIAGNLRIDAAGGPLRLAAEPADPRFGEIYSGLYWQVRDEQRGDALRSVSLWDAVLPLPADTLPDGAVHDHLVPAPEGGMLLLRESRILVADSGRRRPVRISTAINRAEADELAQGFARDLLPGLGLLGLVLLAGAWMQTGAGLRPVVRVSHDVHAIRDGRARRLPPDVPPEIRPLVEEVNALLDRQDADMTRARDRAADLAHGLKTPLTALNADAARLRERGETDLAEDITALAARMHRTVERELARARVRHRSGPAPGVAVGPAAEAIARILRRTPAGEHVDVRVEGERAATVAVDPEDLNEILGNLMENAVRHASGSVRVRLEREADDLLVAVEDDGAGADEERLALLAERGRRYDEKGGAAGLGLAIASDILAAYGRELAFAPSVLGGLRVSLRLPAATVSQPQPS